MYTDPCLNWVSFEDLGDSSCAISMDTIQFHGMLDWLINLKLAPK